MKTDEICELYSGRKGGLSLSLLDGENGTESRMVLIEGPSDALRMLGQLLIAVAEEEANDGFAISPFGAGSAHFSPASEFGVYIHRK